MNWIIQNRKVITELLIILVTSFFVFVLVAGLRGDMYLGIQAGLLIFILYYNRDFFIETMMGGDKEIGNMMSPVMAKLASILVTLFALFLFVFMGSSLIWSLFNGDYCKGWAHSKKYCILEKIDEENNLGSQSPDFYDGF